MFAVRAVLADAHSVQFRNGVTKSAKHILVKADAFGIGMPDQDTILSPDHRIYIHDLACGFLFDEAAVLAPAKGLLGLQRMRAMKGKKSVEYITLLTETHQVIFANGMPAETLYPGPEALQRIGFFGRAQIMRSVLRLGTRDLETAYPPARRLLSVQEAKGLVEVMKVRSRFVQSGPQISDQPTLHAAE